MFSITTDAGFSERRSPSSHWILSTFLSANLNGRGTARKKTGASTGSGETENGTSPRVRGLGVAPAVKPVTVNVAGRPVAQRLTASQRAAEGRQPRAGAGSSGGAEAAPGMLRRVSTGRAGAKPAVTTRTWAAPPPSERSMAQRSAGAGSVKRKMGAEMSAGKSAPATG